VSATPVVVSAWPTVVAVSTTVVSTPLLLGSGAIASVAYAFGVRQSEAMSATKTIESRMPEERRVLA
jgi:hypothetical protein